MSPSDVLGVSRRAWLICALVSAGAAVWLWAYQPFLLDDAYITLHSARHLGEASDPSFRGATPMTGVTSPVHVVMIWLVGRIAPLEVALAVVLGIGWFVYLSGLWAVGAGLASPYRWMLVLTGLLVARMPFQLVNGLETTLSLGMLTWTCAGLNRVNLPRWTPLLAGTLPFLRPEYALFTLAVVGIAAWRGERSLVGGLAVVLLAWTGLTLNIGGSVPPATIAVKRAFYALPPLPWAIVLVRVPLRAVRELGPTLIGMGMFWRSEVMRPIGLAAAALVAGCLAFPIMTLMDSGRYLHFLVPLLLCGLAWLAREHPPLGKAALALSVVWALVMLPKPLASYHYRKAYIRSYVEVSAWLEHHPVATPVLIHDAGYISEATSLPLIDLVGLKSPEVSSIHRALTETSAGARMAEAITKIAALTRPGTFVVQRHFDEVNGLTANLEHSGWTVTALVHAPSDAEFSIYALRPPPDPESK